MRKKRETGNGLMEADGQPGRIGTQISLVAKLIKIVYNNGLMTLLGRINLVDIIVPPSANMPLT